VRGLTAGYGRFAAAGATAASCTGHLKFVSADRCGGREAAPWRATGLSLARAAVEHLTGETVMIFSERRSRWPMIRRARPAKFQT
jgi:hypothetical protein